MKTLLPLALAAFAAAQQEAPVLTHGPFRGHTDATTMHVWARASAAGEFVLEVQNVADGAVATAKASADAEHDFTLHFAIAGLQPANAFTARMHCAEREVFTSGAGAWCTAQPDDARTATIAFGSCADDRQFPEQPIWGRMLARAPHALVLLGDTPYIDDGTVAVRRRRFREFFAVPAIAAALAAIPTWTTWDDRDYATNDTFGDAAGSETARPVFVDYHAHASYGEDGRGIYTSFRRGPIEVFLLDTRTFADRETMPLDRVQQLTGVKAQRSLLGARQKEWLQRGLLASTAPCKVLACGMVWNDAVRPGKADYWGRWPHERAALFEWLGRKEISGVVLVSGDVHRTRVIRHATKDVVGYDLVELVTSPIANTVIESNAAEHPGLLFDRGVEHSFLAVSATPKGNEVSLRAEMVDGAGATMYAFECMSPDLRKRA